MKKNILTAVAAIMMMISLIGCNMMKGAGEDVEDAGKQMQKTVDQNK